MGARRLSFWLAVAGVSVVSQVVIQAATEKYPDSGFAQLVNYAHRGAR